MNMLLLCTLSYEGWDFHLYSTLFNLSFQYEYKRKRTTKLGLKTLLRFLLRSSVTALGSALCLALLSLQSTVAKTEAVRFSVAVTAVENGAA